MIIKAAPSAFLILLTILWSYPHKVAAQINQVPDSIEYQALVDLYNSTNGDGWTNKTNWLNGTTSADFGTWYGVKVASGDVTEIKLIGNNLSGPIPESLGNLNRLIYIHLIDNHLTGEIPSSLGNLQSLNHLKLYSNKLTGEIPATFRVDLFSRSCWGIINYLAKFLNLIMPLLWNI